MAFRSPVPDYLDEIVESLADDTNGAVADYIPELAQADPDRFAVALTTVDGRTYSAGDDDVEFSIQSISKPFAYAAALTDLGLDRVLDKVGVEPSGEAFNELSLEGESHRPMNPMINAGAITTHHLVGGPDCDPDERVQRVVRVFSALAGRELRIDDAVCRSELETADRNLALAHMLRSHGILAGDAAQVVRGYTEQCSILVTVRDLAVMGATLAKGGVQPVTGDAVVEPWVARQVLGVMTACGMYNGAGEWLTAVGIPAKSGVAGGILGALPAQVGIGVFSPRLDRNGNSVRGLRTCRRLSADMGLHLMEAEALGAGALRSVHPGTLPDVGEVLVYELQGIIQFRGAETVLRELEGASESGQPVVFDLARVPGLNDVGRRMILEAMRRLLLADRRVFLVDPDGVLPDPDVGDGRRPEIVPSASSTDRSH
ncbi:glutaminase [Rhodococcus triatomae]|uniref:Glutaminase n=1 Tax=Rhodococcus triatomae TaxID=300028 RepID=A0A1G8AIZ2_9NOCA|nr:glutaminase [Rhodococcus triatomae]QNG17754.1 glutaminase [Rhodococcus triatomae]QNG22578.1 glutaminase [Rhodococcus triatomae]SDH20901.1 L-glutaminase [Rhodococcus triatomae]